MRFNMFTKIKEKYIAFKTRIKNKINYYRSYLASKIAPKVE